jgi:hypothetical protein
MNKSKSVAEQPVGIVIATGSVLVSTPRVRAYFWCEAEPVELSSSEDKTHLVK